MTNSLDGRGRALSGSRPGKLHRPYQGTRHTDNGFHEPPSAPAELMPTLVGATVHNYRYSTFIRETDLRGISINYDDSCGPPPSSFDRKSAHALVNIFVNNRCPVLHLGYLAAHRQQWKSNGTALGEVVYSLSLAPGETRNIAIIDLRRRQQGRRREQTDASEQLLSNQDHTFALQEVATAVALEHQHGKTTTEANTMVTGGAFVAAGAIVGGIGGGIIGTLVEPGVGTAVGAAVGAGAGVAAGGLVFAGANALGMIEADSSGDRQIMADTNQRIAQSTSQQSALIRSLWSTVVTEDVQEENLEARTSNITNYNHMHALNMEYYEVLHEYETCTELLGATPILYLPFGALPLDSELLVDEFWDSIRTGLSEDLRNKGDQVFVEPPPQEFIPETVPEIPDIPPDVQFDLLRLDVEIEWDLEWVDLIAAYFTGPLGLVADEVFKNASLEIELNGNTYIKPASEMRKDDIARKVTTFSGLFDRPFTAAEITGVRVKVDSPLDLIDEGVYLRVLVGAGVTTPPDALSLPGLRIAEGALEFGALGSGREIYAWSPVGGMLDEHARKLNEIAVIEQRNTDGQAAHQAILDQLDTWKQQVLEAVKREPYRFTMIVLSSMEAGRLTWILDRLYFSGDDADEYGAIPLHRIAHTTPIGISSDSVLLRMKTFDLAKAQRIAPQLFNLDLESELDLISLLRWPDKLADRFNGKNNDLTVIDKVFLPGAGVFSEAILGRSNASEYVDPDRYWNWQDSPIPHQAPVIRPVSTAPRAGAPLPTEPTVPDANLPLVTAPDFPDPAGLAGVLQAVQNGNMFRDMSKADQLTRVLGGLADLAAGAADTAATMTGDAAANALNSATEIGKTVASLTESLMANAPAQAAQPPRNPTTATAATTAVERAQDKSDDVLDVTKDAWGVPGSAPPATNGPATDVPGTNPPPLPTQSWRPDIDPGSMQQPGQVSSAPSVPTPIQEAVQGELVDILNTAAEDTGAMPDPGLLIPHLEHWYRDGVIPLLVFARHNEAYLTSAIGQYLDWLANMQQLGLQNEADQMETLHGDAMTLIRVGLENAIRAAFTQMEANNDLDYARDVFDWIALSMQLGIDGQSSLFSVSEVVDASPIHVVLEGPLEPLNTVGVGDQFELTLSGGLAIGANPPLEGKVVDIAINVDNGSAVPAQGVIHSSLDMLSTITRDDTAPMKIEVTGSASLFQSIWTFEAVRAVTIA